MIEITYGYGIILSFGAVIVYWALCRWCEHKSDLSHIPNLHPLAPWTPLWMSWMRWRGLEFEVARIGSEKHGSIIRVGPKDIFLSSIDTVKDVYGFGKMNVDKPPFQDVHMLYGSRTMFTALTAEPHRVRKQRFSRYYTQSFLTSNPHVQVTIASIAENLREILDDIVDRDITADALALAGGFGFDIFTTLVYGRRGGTNYLGNPNDHTAFVDTWYESHVSQADFWRSELPVIQTILTWIGCDPVRKRHRDALERFEQWGLERVVAAEQDLKAPSLALEDEPSIFTMMRANLLESSPERGACTLSSDDPRLLEIAAELLDHFAGFGDVFPSAISAPIWFLSYHPIEQQRLQRELEDTFSQEKDYNPYNQQDAGSANLSIKLASLKYLDAVIHESLRLRLTPPSPNPRMTAGGHATTIGPFNNIPGETRIQTFPWILHRDEKYFPDAETWNPERWLGSEVRTGDDTGGHRARNGPKDGYWAFGSGARGCVGRSMSLELIRHFLTAIYTSYTTTIVSDAEYGVPNTSGIIFLRRNSQDKLWVRFERIKRS